MISQEIISQVTEKLNSLGVEESIISALRQEFTPVHFTYCSDDDIPNNQPIVEQDKFNIYLVDGRGHCMSLTHDLENATGIVVAEIYQD